MTVATDHVVSNPTHPPKPHHRFVAVIASFGAMKPKAAFRFIGGACPDYVTAPFLAPLQETGTRLILCSA